jgi:hypothetical protein
MAVDSTALMREETSKPRASRELASVQSVPFADGRAWGTPPAAGWLSHEIGVILSEAVLSILLTLTVEIPIYLGVSLPPAAYDRAIEEVERLFDPGGIDFMWQVASISAVGPHPHRFSPFRAALAPRSGGGPPLDRLAADGGRDSLCSPCARAEGSHAPASALATIVVLARPESPVITGCSRGLHDHRLGLTDFGTRRVTVWTEQVVRAASGRWDGRSPPGVRAQTLGIALGRVLAHELGHLFLSLNGHREKGLMKANFSHRALVGTSDRSFRLSPEDLERVRKTLTRLEPSAVAQRECAERHAVGVGPHRANGCPTRD